MVWAQSRTLPQTPGFDLSPQATPRPSAAAASSPVAHSVIGIIQSTGTELAVGAAQSGRLVPMLRSPGQRAWSVLAVGLWLMVGLAGGAH